MEEYKVIKDFTADLLTTFPELKDNAVLGRVQGGEEAAMEEVRAHLLTQLPPQFLHIISENPVLFETECFIFPGVDFHTLWKEELSEKTRATIWKYLKLLLIMVTMKAEKGAFEGVDFNMFQQPEMKAKMEEAMKDVHEFFTNPEKMPSADDLNEHLKGLMDGKIGALAKEITEDCMGGNTPESLQGMLKDPSKMMGLVTKVGDTIEKKIKSGDIKESELLAEAQEMLDKMKSMPGMGQFGQMFSKMAGGGKVDLKGMQTKLDQQMKGAKNKERLREKLAKRQEAEEKKSTEPMTEDKFTVGEGAERSSPGDKKKKKKGKK
jgi:hypothetical protein